MPTTSTLTSVTNQIATYFAGPYDSARRLYWSGVAGTQLVAGLYSIKTARPANFDAKLWDLGAATPPAISALAILDVGADDDMEQRVALPAVNGVKKVTHDVMLTVMFRGSTPYAEDVTLAIRAMRDALATRLRADITCGSGGFEVGGFQLAETSPWLRFRYGGVSSISGTGVKSSAGLTKGTLIMATEAHYYVVA